MIFWKLRKIPFKWCVSTLPSHYCTQTSHYRHTIVTLSSHWWYIPFERSLSQLSEKHKIFDFRPTEFKLWQLKDSQNQIKRMGVTVKLIQCQIFYDFLKAQKNTFQMVCFHTTITLLYTNVTLSSHYRHTDGIYHLKGLFLSFQKNINIWFSIHRIQVMAAKRFPKSD